jgi:hypothetical protein
LSVRTPNPLKAPAKKKKKKKKVPLKKATNDFGGFEITVLI